MPTTPRNRPWQAGWAGKHLSGTSSGEPRGGLARNPVRFLARPSRISAAAQPCLSLPLPGGRFPVTLGRRDYLPSTGDVPMTPPRSVGAGLLVLAIVVLGNSRSLRPAAAEPLPALSEKEKARLMEEREAALQQAREAEAEGDWKKAVTHANQFVKLTQQLFGPQHDEVAVAFDEKAELCARHEDWATAQGPRTSPGNPHDPSGQGSLAGGECSTRATPGGYSGPTQAGAASGPGPGQ